MSVLRVKMNAAYTEQMAEQLFKFVFLSFRSTFIQNVNNKTMSLTLFKSIYLFAMFTIRTSVRVSLMHIRCLSAI